MTKKSVEPLIVDDVLLSAEQLSKTRWPGMHPRVIADRLKAAGVPQVRIGSRTLRYRLSDIVEYEAQATTRTKEHFRREPKVQQEVDNA
jgi:hypothetical protein